MRNVLPAEFREERALIAEDGARLWAGHAPGPQTGGLAAVLLHGFSMSSDADQNLAVLRTITRSMPVVAVDLRGHGRSDGISTLGHREILDVAAAVNWARVLGYPRVVTVGFSMGGAVALRHAGLMGGVAGVAAVSSPAFWHYRGTAAMRLLHRGIEHPVGRFYLRRTRTRVLPPPWPEPWPETPEQSAARIPSVPLLLVHGAQDGFLPLEHPRALRRAAAAGAAERGVPDRTALWIEDFGHAEVAIPLPLVGRISAWLREQTA